MVVVCITLASTPLPGGGEHVRTYCYSVDGTREETQGTIRDNNRGSELVGLILKGSPRIVAGEPPEGSNPVISCYLAVANSRGRKSSHSLSYERHDFSSRYNEVVGSFMSNCVEGMRRILRKACKARDDEKAAKEAARKLRENGDADGSEEAEGGQVHR